MKSENIIKTKSYAFAVRVVNLYKYLSIEKKEFVMSKQLLKAGTSVGALVMEAENAESKKDFIHKLSISQKEANETNYWLSLLKDTDYISTSEFASLENDCIELQKLLTSILKTAKNNLINN